MRDALSTARISDTNVGFLKQVSSSNVSSTAWKLLHSKMSGSTDALKSQWHKPFCTHSIEELSKAHHLITKYEHVIISVLTISKTLTTEMVKIMV